MGTDANYIPADETQALAEQSDGEGFDPGARSSGLDALLKKARNNQRKQRAKNPGNEPIQLSFLPDVSSGSRAWPNTLARSALFSAKKDGDRFHVENKQVASLSNLIIEYTGSELRQDDASVLMTLFYLGRSTPAGDPVLLTPYQLLKELGWTINSREYAHLRECCTRLSATNVTVRTKTDTRGYAGSLIRKFKWEADDPDKPLEFWELWLEPEIVYLFSEAAFTLLDWDERKAIGTRAKLALWLHTFYMTHTEPVPISVARYFELTNSGMRNLSDFRRNLRVALGRLQEVGFLVDWRIQDDLVHVKRRTPKRFSVKRPARIERLLAGADSDGLDRRVDAI